MRKRKRKLAYIIHGIVLGGAEVAMLSALEKLDSQYDLRVYVLGRVDERLVDGLRDELKAKIVRYRIPTILFPIYLPLVIYSLIKFRPNIVVSSLWRSAIVASIYKSLYKQFSYFILVHSDTFFHAADAFCSTLGMRKSNAIFADSLASQSFVHGVIQRGKPTLILSYLTAKPLVRSEYDYSGAIRFLFLGRLHPVKRVPLAIRAIAWLRSKGVNATLTICGRPDGDEQRIVKEIARFNLESFITIAGEVLPEHRSDLFLSHNAYIQLSEHEGMAMSVAEAMLHGEVCFVTPVGNIKSYASDGYSAIFADVSNCAAWEGSLNRLKEILDDVDRCKEMSKHSQSVFNDMPTFGESLVDAIERYS